MDCGVVERGWEDGFGVIIKTCRDGVAVLIMVKNKILKRNLVISIVILLFAGAVIFQSIFKDVNLLKKNKSGNAMHISEQTIDSTGNINATNIEQEYSTLESDKTESKSESSQISASTTNSNQKDSSRSVPTDNNVKSITKTSSVINDTKPTPSPAMPTSTSEPEPTPSPKPANKLVSAAIGMVDNKAKSIAKGKVTLNDYLEVYQVVVGKLSIGEIKYLIDSAKSDYWESTPVEQIEKARKILFSKLSDEEISKLREIGRRYGRSMDIVNKDLDVAEAKQKQMEAKGLK